MTVEVKGSNSGDRRLINTVAIAAGELLIAQGVEGGVAATTGTLGSEYGSAVIFTALREMGHWPPKDFDADEFERTASRIVQESK